MIRKIGVFPQARRLRGTEEYACADVSPTDSKRILRNFYNKPFDREEMRAQLALDAVVKEKGTFFKRGSRGGGSCRAAYPLDDALPLQGCFFLPILWTTRWMTTRL
jgi:hypothetical protein